MFHTIIIYLCTPLYLFLFTFLNTWWVLLSALCLMVLACYLWHTRQEDRGAIVLKRYWMPLLLVAVIVYAGVWSPFNYWDWMKHFALFNLLIDHPWPPQIVLDGETHFLRYGIGWYLVPALLAKLSAVAVLTPALYLWTLVGTCLALLLVLPRVQQPRHMLLLVLSFFFFSGLDIVGAWLTQGLTHKPLTPDWLQWWSGWGQIPPGLFGSTFTPQHAIPAWLGACLLIAARRLTVQYGALLLVAVLLWSPLAAIGMIPLLLWALWKEGLHRALTLPNLVLAPLLSVPLLFYFAAEAREIPMALITAKTSLYSFAQFCVLEFGLATLLILMCCPRAERSLTLTCFLTLMLLSSVSFGRLNDLLMRGSIAAICVLSIITTAALLNNTRRWYVTAGKLLLAVYLLVAAIPVVTAFAKGIDPRAPRIAKDYRFSQTYSAHESLRYQYMARLRARTKLYLRE